MSRCVILVPLANNPFRSQAVRPYSKEEIRAYVDAELWRAPGRRARLRRFIDGHCDHDPKGLVPFGAVYGCYKEWCAQQKEHYRPGELKRLLHEAGFVVWRGWVRQMSWRAVLPTVEAPLGQAWWPVNRLEKERGVPASLLRLMRDNGTGPPWRTAGRAVLYCVESFDAWLARCPRMDVPPESLIRECVAACFTLAGTLFQRSRHGRPYTGALPVTSRDAVLAWTEILQTAEDWFALNHHGNAPKKLGVALRKYLLSHGCKEVRFRRRRSTQRSRPREIWGLWKRLQ